MTKYTVGVVYSRAGRVRLRVWIVACILKSKGWTVHSTNHLLSWLFRMTQRLCSSIKDKQSQCDIVRWSEMRRMSGVEWSSIFCSSLVDWRTWARFHFSGAATLNYSRNGTKRCIWSNTNIDKRCGRRGPRRVSHKLIHRWKSIFH